MATLFSYFNKTPKSTSKSSPASGDTPKGKSNNSPKENAKLFTPTGNGKSTPKTSKHTSKIAPRKELKNGSDKNLVCGEVVWAKMEGHPWWPSLICNHPTKNNHLKGTQCHVQFFGKPPSRGWVENKQIKPFNKDEAISGDSAVQNAVSEAKKALSLSFSERLSLVSCIPSDEEDDSMDEENVRPQQNGVSGTGTKRSRTQDSDDDDDNDDEVTGRKSQSKRPRRQAAVRADQIKKKKKKRAAIESDSDSGEASDYKPDNESSEDESDGSVVAEEPEESLSEPESEEDIKEKVSKKRKQSSSSTSAKPKNKTLCTPVASKTPKSTSSPSCLTPSLTNKLTNSVGKAAASLAKFQMTPSSSSPAKNSNVLSRLEYTHDKLDWLKDDKRKDIKGRSMNHEDYDPRTLLLPTSYVTSKEVTPGMRQWWQIKSHNYDTVLFFKVGKFYELYHMDAVTGVKELGLVFMKGNFAHAGFPEHAYGRYSETLIQKGYKVGRIEQTETPDMMTERTKKEGGAKVVMRELCAITTKGTKTYSFLDGNCTDNDASYLLAIKEKGAGDSVGGETTYGVCFVDTSIGKFHLGQFTDDRQCSRLRTLTAHYTPAQILIERGGTSTKTQSVLNHDLMAVMKEVLVPSIEFWDATKTLKKLSETCFIAGEDQPNSYEMWPQTLKDMTENGLSAEDGFELCLSAFGACVWYLKKCFIADEILSMKNFEVYTPLDAASKKSNQTPFSGKQHMILDGVTLNNLDIVINEDGGAEGTLLDRMDHCATAFGKRLFKQWLCTPLCNPAAINDRLNAVEDLMSMPAVTTEVQEILKTVPDLERLLSKIHCMGMSSRGEDHPDSRAIFYNETRYSKRKINDFLSTLDGFKKTVKIINLFKDQQFSSKLLKMAVTTKDNKGNFPVLNDLLTFFDHAFNHKKAKEDGIIVPQQGVNDDYDQAIQEMDLIKHELDKHLDQQRKLLGNKAIVFWGSAKGRFQLEIPESVVQRGIPDNYELQSQKKGYKRYWTPFIKEHFHKFTDAEDKRDVALKDTMRLVFYRFDESYKEWESAVQSIAVLEALVSLSLCSSQSEGVMCRPEVVLPEDLDNSQPFIEIREGRHPCVSSTYTGDNFIPNDAVIGIPDSMDDDGDDGHGESCCVLVTGPNMGGKSTLMRQTGLIIIMAQLGCYVPAESCRLNPVDRVFTRLGAHDRIFSGESTFFVELAETSSILQHATRHSLVLLDELGRGTATYDGTAIASAVVQELTNEVKCRTFFSTHYHSLVEEFATNPLIRLGHMACMVENDEEDGDPSKETITFLYKFVKGACPKSYGFNAARLAGIPEEVISVAVKKAKHFEETVERLKLFRSLLNDGDISQDSIIQCQKIKC